MILDTYTTHLSHSHFSQHSSTTFSFQGHALSEKSSLWISHKIHMLNCKINGTVHIFFLKKSYLSPRCPKLPQFFSSGVYPLYLHVIIDFGHIWGPFMAEIEKMCQKSAFLVVPDFGYPQSRGPPWKLAHWKCCPNCFWWLLYMLGLCHFIFATFSNEKVFTVTANVTVTVVPLEF